MALLASVIGRPLRYPCKIEQIEYQQTLNFLCVSLSHVVACVCLCVRGCKMGGVEAPETFTWSHSFRVSHTVTLHKEPTLFLMRQKPRAASSEQRAAQCLGAASGGACSLELEPLPRLLSWLMVLLFRQPCHLNIYRYIG